VLETSLAVEIVDETVELDPLDEDNESVLEGAELAVEDVEESTLAEDSVLELTDEDV
jgi:hypothetical protein